MVWLCDCPCFKDAICKWVWYPLFIGKGYERIENSVHKLIDKGYGRIDTTVFIKKKWERYTVFWDWVLEELYAWGKCNYLGEVTNNIASRVSHNYPNSNSNGIMMLHRQNLLCKLGSKRDAISFHYGTLKEPISVLLEPREILGGNQLIIGFGPDLVHLHVFIPNSIIISFVPSKKILKLGPSQLKFFIPPWSCEIRN